MRRDKPARPSVFTRFLPISSYLHRAGDLLYLLVPILLISLYTCHGQRTVLDRIKDRGELRIVTRNAPTTYYEQEDEQYAGIEHDMASAFASYLGVTPRFIVKDTVSEMLLAVATGEADLAAAGLTLTDERSQHYRFGPVYQEVQQQVVCRRNTDKVPASIEQLDGLKLMVPEDTSYAEKLRQLHKQYPDLSWQTHTEWDTETLLENVWRQKLDCTVADSTIFSVNQRYLPELVAAFPLADKELLAWPMGRDSSKLQQAVFDWFEGLEENGELSILMERYYGYLEEFDYVDTRKFQNRIKKILPKYRKWFEQAAAQYQLDWMLLAAQSYQESHWNPRARSPTGVRGMMMLTLPTARQLGVKSRLDARSNIFAGARHLARLRGRLPGQIQEPERSWMALAAYNLGFGHLMDARELALLLERDPDNWQDLEQTLPLLARKKYYQDLRHGYARGGEAVDYVRRIRDYRDILAQRIPKLVSKP